MGTPLQTPDRFLVARLARFLLVGTACALAAASGGCVWDTWHVFGKADAPAGGPADSMVLRGDHLEPETHRRLRARPPRRWRRPRNCSARVITRRPRSSSTISPTKRRTLNTIAEEARYYEAECLRLPGQVPEGRGHVSQAAGRLPVGAHREQAGKRIRHRRLLAGRHPRGDAPREGETRGQALVYHARIVRSLREVQAVAGRGGPGPGGPGPGQLQRHHQSHWPLRPCSWPAPSSFTIRITARPTGCSASSWRCTPRASTRPRRWSWRSSPST